MAYLPRPPMTSNPKIAQLQQGFPLLSFEEHPGQHLSVGCVHEIVVVDGHHLLTFYKFASGLIDIDGQKGVCLSSLESSINAIELNTCSLTIAKGFTQLDHDDVLVLVV